MDLAKHCFRSVTTLIAPGRARKWMLVVRVLLEVLEWYSRQDRRPKTVFELFFTKIKYIKLSMSGFRGPVGQFLWFKSELGNWRFVAIVSVVCVRTIFMSITERLSITCKKHNFRSIIVPRTIRCIVDLLSKHCTTYSSKITSSLIEKPHKSFKVYSSTENEKKHSFHYG